MFYKFGDNTKTKTVIKKSSIENHKDHENNEPTEIYDENDNTNRRSAIMNKYTEEEIQEENK